VAGEASLDAESRWSRVRVDVDGENVPVDVPGDALLDVEGAPALVGATAQRLIRSGLRPGQSREVEVVRVRSNRSVTRLTGRCIWVGGREWRLILPLESTGFSVRPDRCASSSARQPVRSCWPAWARASSPRSTC
jgi:hypothetical protein